MARCLIRPNWKGADPVFTAGKGGNLQKPTVELKDVAGGANLSTLGESLRHLDYGGSIGRVASLAKGVSEGAPEQFSGV